MTFQDAKDILMCKNDNTTINKILKFDASNCDIIHYFFTEHSLEMILKCSDYTHMNVYETDGKTIENTQKHILLDFQKDIFSKMIDTLFINKTPIKTFNIFDKIIMCDTIPETNYNNGFLINSDFIENYDIKLNYTDSVNT
jgi:hypothetical protein